MEGLAAEQVGSDPDAADYDDPAFSLGRLAAVIQNDALLMKNLIIPNIELPERMLAGGTMDLGEGILRCVCVCLSPFGPVAVGGLCW